MPFDHVPFSITMEKFILEFTKVDITIWEGLEIEYKSKSDQKDRTKVYKLKTMRKKKVKF
jgi:hypothetical protein